MEFAADLRQGEIQVREAAMPNKTVRDIMSKGPVTLGRDDTLDLAKDIMTLGRIRHFPVVEKE